MTTATSRMATAAYRTLVEVQQRAPGQSATGAPSGAWLSAGTYWGEQLASAPGSESPAGSGPRAVRKLALRLRWFPGWESVLRLDRRAAVEGVSYGITAVTEEPAAGTDRTLRVDLVAVRPEA